MKFRLTYPEHVYTILTSNADDDDIENDSEDEEEIEAEIDEEENKKEIYTNVYYSIKNVREEHMMTKVIFFKFSNRKI